jgi:predicted kinase
MLANTLILIRGLPGAGKSSLAKLLSEDQKYPVHAIDDYFTNTETGEYQFNFSENYLAYKQCENLTENSMKNGALKVFVDNTFTFNWEMEPYFKLANIYNYKLFVVTVEKYHNGSNIHEVSMEQLQKMAEKYKVKLL